MPAQRTCVPTSTAPGRMAPVVSADLAFWHNGPVAADKPTRSLSTTGRATSLTAVPATTAVRAARPTPMPQQFGVVLRRLRRRRGLSQVACAGLIGRSESWVSQVERGERSVDRISVLRQLATVLDVEFKTLLEAVAA
jgi:ribosome-binding protein aMBF1 (putative translation factor)